MPSIGFLELILVMLIPTSGLVITGAVIYFAVRLAIRHERTNSN